jgi:hypothetical protein
MRAAFIGLFVLIFGCSKPPQQAIAWKDWAQPTILDTVLTKAEHSNAIEQAERDLPDDNWRTNFFGPENLSRGDREGAVGATMLAEIKPRLQGMTVTELIKSLKVMPYPDGLTNDYEGVAAYLYYWGNEAILDEIKSRPTNELQVLRGLATDKIDVYRGRQGPMGLLDSVIKYEILRDKPDG